MSFDHIKTITVKFDDGTEHIYKGRGIEKFRKKFMKTEGKKGGMIYSKDPTYQTSGIDYRGDFEDIMSAAKKMAHNSGLANYRDEMTKTKDTSS
ncbi:MAG: hypothetical protein ACOCT9_03120 [archaeon]